MSIHSPFTHRLICKQVSTIAQRSDLCSHELFVCLTHRLCVPCM